MKMKIKIINENKTHEKNNENNDNNVEREEPLGSRVEGEMVAMVKMIRVN